MAASSPAITPHPAANDKPAAIPNAILEMVMTHGCNQEVPNNLGVIRAERLSFIHLSTNLSELLVCHPADETS